MAQLTASRTLVKSSPELWAECSDAASLARHLGAFGEIQITKLEPETAVAWEGEDVRGTVTLEPSGWGTRVVLTAELPTPAVGVGEPAGLTAAPQGGEEPEPVAPLGTVTTVEPGNSGAAEPGPEAGPSDPVMADERDPVAADEPDLVAPDVSDSVTADEPGFHANPELPRLGLFRRLFGGRRRPAAPAAALAPVSAPAPAPAPALDPVTVETPPVRTGRIRPPIAPIASKTSALGTSGGHAALIPPVAPVVPAEPDARSAEPDSRSAEALVGALDSLGRAHRRPFSHG